MMLNNFLKKSLMLMLIMGLCVANPQLVYGKKEDSIIFICPYTSTSVRVTWAFLNNTDYPIQISDGTTILPLNSPHPRASIVKDLTTGMFNLNMSGLQDSDEGTYKCTVSPNQQEYKLELLAAPSSLILQDLTTGNKILGVEGQSLTLRCSATGGKPPPMVTITVDNVPKSAEQSVNYTITRLERTHNSQGIYCRANSTALTSPMFANATLYLYLKPSQPTFSQDPISVNESQLLEVSCNSTGSRPAATFQWTIGMMNITSNSSPQISNTGDDIYTVISTLKLHMDRTYNGQSITCTAGNIAATNGNSKILDVKFAPNITVANVNYTQNDATRSITCNPFGNPDNYTYYKWQHKSTYGVLIRELAGVKFLTLPSVPLEARYQDSGEYVCIAGNGITDRDGKTEQSGSGYVIINANPVFTSGNNPTEYGEFRKDVDIHVYVYTAPKYTLVMWSKSSTTITNGDKYILSETVATVNDTFHNTPVMVNGYRFTLTIKNLLDTDFNVNYSILLSNNVGQAVYTTLLLSSSGPETPVNFTISSSSQSSISVQWIPGYNGGHEQTFYLQYRVYGNSIWEESAKIVDVKQTIQTYTLHGLQDGTLYEFRMLAENKVNKSSPTQTERMETLTLKDCKLSSQSVVESVAGGLSAVIVILIIIILVLLILRKQETSKQRSKELKSRNKAKASFYNSMDSEETDEKEDPDKIKSMATQEYETLGMQDNPNTYSELRTVQDQLKTRYAPEYETLGVMDNPNTYSELHGQQNQTKAENTADHCESLPNQDKYNVYKKTNVQLGLEHSEYTNLKI